MVRKLRSGDVDMGIVGYDMVREYGKVSISNFMCKHFKGSVFFLTQEKKNFSPKFGTGTTVCLIMQEIYLLRQHVCGIMSLCISVCFTWGRKNKILCFFHVARMVKISLLFMMLLDMESATLQSEYAFSLAPELP